MSTPLDFWLFLHHTQAAPDNQIRRASMRRVVEAFLRTGERSTEIEWTAD